MSWITTTRTSAEDLGHPDKKNSSTADGLNVQTVNDLLTMYVGAASQHVLRMSICA